MTVILCNGQFPSHSIPLKMLDEASQIVCCDGATVKLVESGRKPDAIVGDLDSLPQEYKKQFSEIIYHDPCQETNDLTKAVEWCINKRINDIVIIGATGLREDHSMANTILLAEYAQKINVKMYTDSGIFTPILESGTIESFAGQSISIFVLSTQTKITTTGLKYEVTNRIFQNLNEGTLNTALSDKFKIEFDKGKILIFQEYK